MRKRYANMRDLAVGYYRRESDDGQIPTGSMYFEGDVMYSYGEHFPLVVRTAYDMYIVNGDRYSNTTAKHQSVTFRTISNGRRVEIPFSALENVVGRGYGRTASVDGVREIRVVDSWEDEWLNTGKLDKKGEWIFEHRLGAALLEYQGRKFVSSIDKSGTGRGLYFLTELVDSEVTTLDDAFVSMMPEEVFDEDYKRQGEWFFVPIEDLLDSVIAHAEKEYSLKHRDAEKQSRHYATFGMEVQGRQFVWGIVKHTQQQHKQLKLYDTGTKPKDRVWYEAFESTQVQSWSAGGNVD